MMFPLCDPFEFLNFISQVHWFSFSVAHVRQIKISVRSTLFFESTFVVHKLVLSFDCNNFGCVRQMFLAALAWFFPMAIILVLIFLGAMFLFFRKPPISPSSEDTFPSEENLRAMDRVFIIIIHFGSCMLIIQLKQITDQQLRSKVPQRTRADIVKNVVVLGNGIVHLDFRALSSSNLY
jgi:hypothetical protein